MSEKLYVKNPLFPMAGIAVSVFTFAFGLAIAKSPGVFLFVGGVWRGRGPPPRDCTEPGNYGKAAGRANDKGQRVYLYG